MTTRHSVLSYTFNSMLCRFAAPYTGGESDGIFNLNNHTMKENRGNWTQRVSISKLPKILLLGILLAASFGTFAQNAGSTSAAQQEPPMARMMLDNTITVRTGLNAEYKIPMSHFGFESVAEANAYFNARQTNYVTFIVQDVNTAIMQLDLTNPAVQGWTISDWMNVLNTRAANSSPRTLN